MRGYSIVIIFKGWGLVSLVPCNMKNPLTTDLPSVSLCHIKLEIGSVLY